MADALVALARSGAPTPAGSPVWPVYDRDRRPTMVFDHTSRVEDDPYGDTRALWDDVATEHLRISR